MITESVPRFDDANQSRYGNRRLIVDVIVAIKIRGAFYVDAGESRLPYRDACCIIFMVFSRGRYDSRSLVEAFPSPFSASLPPSPYDRPLKGTLLAPRFYDSRSLASESSEIPYGFVAASFPLIIPGGAHSFD